MDNFLKNCGIKALYNFPFLFKNNFENSVFTKLLFLNSLLALLVRCNEPILMYFDNLLQSFDLLRCTLKNSIMGKYFILKICFINKRIYITVWEKIGSTSL